MEETISIQELVGILKKRVGLIIISMFLGLGIAAILTYFILTPQYSSQAQLIVRLPQNETTNVNDINGNLQMINTYKDLIKSDTVMTEVQKRMQTQFDSELSLEAIGASVSINQSQNSQMFSIISKGTDPIVAQNIANQTALVFQEKAKDMLNVDKITIISAATTNLKPVSPNNNLNLLIGIVVGLLVGITLTFIFELFDKTIKDDRFVTEEFGFAILGVVPNMTVKEQNATMVRTQVLKEKMLDEELQKTAIVRNNTKFDNTTDLPSRKSRSRV
jgi:capsular polysaccharide biosynthesis protein